jgi:hypothetical protein
LAKAKKTLKMGRKRSRLSDRRNGDKVEKKAAKKNAMTGAQKG